MRSVFKRTFWMLLVLPLLTACSFSLAEDITPPPDIDLPTRQQSPTVTAAPYPLVPPDPTQGKPVYAEKCASCHGVTGEGDGFQADELPDPVPPLDTPALVRSVKPSQWFNVVTRGRLERFMPGFSTILTERQRWDVVAYLLTLGTPNEEVEEGARVYRQSCQECHGVRGEGDGAKAASLDAAVPDWTDPTYLNERSNQDIWLAVTNGRSPAMPAFAESLADEQRWAAAAYVRSLSFVYMPQPTPSSAAPTPAPDVTQTPVQPTLQATAAAETKVTLTGQIVNASGGSVPVGMIVTLQGFDAMQPAVTRTTLAGTDGSFTFESVERIEGRVYIAQVRYEQLSFYSDVVHSIDLEPDRPVNLLIKIYNPSNDASQLKADRMHLFFDFSQTGWVRVVELLIISNTSDHLVVASEPGQPVLTFELPDGATNLQFQDGALGERFTALPKGFGDTQSIPPGVGAHQIYFAYDLPYPSRKLPIALKLPVAVDAVVVMIPVDGIHIQSEQLIDTGERTVQDMNFHVYTGNSLTGGSLLEMTLIGKPNANTAAGGNTMTGLLVGLGGLGVALVVAGIWLYRRQKLMQEEEEPAPKPEAPETEESLIDAILALDDLYQSGSLPEQAYQQRRATLKEQLRVVRQAGKGA